MLTMSLATYTAKAIATNDALKTFSLRNTYDVDKSVFLEDIHGYCIAQIQFGLELFELNKFSCRSNTRLLEVTLQRSRGVFLFLFVISQLNSFIAIDFHRFDLSNMARASFDNSAWNVLSIGTENGCHSDFLSN